MFIILTLALLLSLSTCPGNFTATSTADPRCPRCQHSVQSNRYLTIHHCITYKSMSPRDLVGNPHSGLMQTTLHGIACFMEQQTSLFVLHGVVYDGKTGRSCCSVLECNTTNRNHDPADAGYVQLSMKVGHSAARCPDPAKSRTEVHKRASVTQPLRPVSACEDGSANERLPDRVNALPQLLLPVRSLLLLQPGPSMNTMVQKCMAAGVDMLR